MGIVNFSPKQDGTGDPSPTNVRPIHPGLVLKSKNLLSHDGWTVGTTYRYIKLIDEDQLCNMSFTLKDSSIDISGIYIGFALTEPTSASTLNNGYRWCIEKGTIKSAKTNTVYYPTTTAGQLCTYCVIYPATQDVFDRLFSAYDIQVEFGSTPTEYEPYYDMEIYGGYVDFENGELVVTHGTYSYTKDSTFEYRNNGRFVIATISEMLSGDFYTDENVVCDRAVKVNNMGDVGDSVLDIKIGANTNSIYLYHSVGVTGATTEADFRNWLADNPITVTYPFATPITHSLTASQLTQAYNQLVPVSPVMLARRRRIMMQRNPNILYEAWNLSFNGTDEYINTGVYLFTQENINRDFELVAEGIAADNSKANNTIICAKHDSNAYGFLVRIENNATAQYNGTIKVWPTPSSIVIRRINGVITLNGTNIKNPSVQFTNAVFDWPLLLGCAIDDNGHTFRYRKGTIDHVCVRWL